MLRFLEVTPSVLLTEVCLHAVSQLGYVLTKEKMLVFFVGGVGWLFF